MSSEAPRFTWLSRRALMHRVAFAVGGTAGLAAYLQAKSADAAQIPKAVVGYQDTPHGNQRCDNCAQFEPPSSCKVVAGDIVPNGWCEVWVTKPTSG